MTTSASSSSGPTLDKPFHGDHFASLPHVPCVTLYHRNGRAGCGTRGRSVMTGRLAEWTSVAGGGDGGGDGGGGGGGEKVPPYVAVLDEEEFTAENVAKLVAASENYLAGDEYGAAEDGGGPLRGVLVLASNSTGSNSDGGGGGATSPESPSPRGEDTPSSSLSIGTTYQWNAAGDGLADADLYGVPAAYVSDAATADYLRSVASEQGAAIAASAGGGGGGGDDEGAYPSIVSEFNYYMGPGGEFDDDGAAIFDSQKCLGWKDTAGEWNPRCAPLGGNSVWAAAGSPLGGNDNDGGDDDGDGRPAVIVAAPIDATSMFHDLSPGANSAASSVLATLLAAELVGSLSDATLDDLPARIVFAFFQGESYGYLGSRRFLKDVVEGFACDGDEVPSVRKDGDEGVRACLRPPRADLTFRSIGTVRGMIATDQVGNLGGAKGFYVHGGDDADGGSGFATFLSGTLVELSASDDANGYVAQASSVEAEDDGVVSLPPTPLTSLVKLSSSTIGGVVLAGYDDAFVDGSYHSHLDSTSSGRRSVDKDAIASAATLLARAAVAAAYRSADGGDEVDCATAAAYASESLPDAADSASETFATLYECLFEDGNCEAFLTRGTVERRNDAARTGLDLGLGVPLGKPPSYYASIYDSSNGQAFVRASGKYYGSMVHGGTDADGIPVKDYGDDESDAFLLRPSLLEASLFGTLNDFLGRGSFVAVEEEVEGEDGGGASVATAPTLATCRGGDDCASVEYCDGTTPTCAGGTCVCGSRAHYHPALDEALTPAANRKPGMFEVAEDDEGASALYAEPYWSPRVGVRIYNDAGGAAGGIAAGVGAGFALACVAATWKLKRTMTKEKVY
ncbi:hypothetical protein ACHAWF_012666 [Thalassiosira exigua]